MPYGQKYFAQTLDRKNQLWEVQFYQDGYAPESGDPVELIGGDPMLSLIYEGENENPLTQQIKTSRVEINLMAQDIDFENAINSMLSASETEWRVDLCLVVGVNKYLKWRGNLLPDTYQRQRAPYPFLVTLVATDGLGRLKDIPFEDPNESSGEYTGRESQLQVMINILNFLGHELQIVNVDEWFESTMASAGAGDDPLVQARIDQSIYWDTESSKGWPCWDVLTDILKRKSLQLCQSLGAWFITQLPECANATLLERRYDYNGAIFSAIAGIDRSVVIDETATNFIEFGATERAEKPVANVSIDYDHGYLESYLSNGSMEYWDEGYVPLPFPLVWTLVDKGSGIWGHGTIHYYDGVDSLKIHVDHGDPLSSGYDPYDPISPDDVTHIEQECFEIVIVDPKETKTLQLQFAAFAGLIGDDIANYDPLDILNAYYALTCGDYAAQVNFDGTKIEWVANSANPIWIDYGSLLVAGAWNLITSLPIDAPPVAEKIRVYFTTMTERVPAGHSQSCDLWYLDAVKLTSEIEVPTTLRTLAELNSPISTAPEALGTVYHGDGPVVEATSRITILSGSDEVSSVLWNKRGASAADVPLSSLQTALIASTQRNACRVISGNILAEFAATSVLVIDGTRFILCGGNFNIDNASCQGVWQEIKDDGEDSTVTETILQSSGGAGGGGGSAGGGGGAHVNVRQFVTSFHQAVVAGPNAVSFGSTNLITSNYETLTFLYDSDGVLIEWSFTNATSKLVLGFTYNAAQAGMLFGFAIVNP